MKTAIAACFAMAFAASLAAQDLAETEGYEVELPSQDVATDKARLLEENSPEDSLREIIDRFSTHPDRFTQTSGEALYKTSCMGCHMPDGRGAEGAGHYPPLAGNPKLVSKYFIVTVLLTGYHGMPRFGDQMDDAQIAEVSNYVRTHFGNDYSDAVTAEDVSELR
ncbi:cytochrome c [Marivita sp. GX14005]|uniref:c-type cytochrome n=1 Tax=Marivita sp. GX14005 TaxID=2942276 RepID=UPI002019E0D0|nr:cytochrome c [Marivita sp. GX14005]MCL3883578.1 cytochrome c [Marivita sp. GX14005]